MKEKKEKALLILILGGFLVLQWRLVGRDFYYDEIITFHEFVLSSFTHITTKYVNLNNHVLFSLIVNLYAKVAHISGEVALAHPWALRAPCVGFSLVTLVYVWMLSGRNLYAPLILATTLPFYYYAPALRGYSLGVMLFTMVMYYTERIKR